MFGLSGLAAACCAPLFVALTHPHSCHIWLSLTCPLSCLLLYPRVKYMPSALFTPPPTHNIHIQPSGHLLRSGKHVHVKGVNMLGKCRRLRVRSTQPGVAVPWETDGEPQGHFEAVEIKVLPGALKLLSGKPPAPVVL